MVADDAAQQPVVGGRDPVVVVERDGGKHRNIDAVFVHVVHKSR